MTAKYLVLKYYEYVPVKDPKAFQEAQKVCCIANKLMGRIKIADEGITGTISGSAAGCERYMATLRKYPGLERIQFNISEADAHPHERLQVLLKKEIVNSGLPKDIMPSQNRAERNYIDAATFQKMRNQKDVVIIDVRSTYEHLIGKFENAITFDISAFRYFFKKALDYPFDKNKKYIVYCTRGIKSEKARDFLKKRVGLRHVFTLEGGVLDYAHHTDGKGYIGDGCYVFDRRRKVAVNKVNPVTISHCHHCKRPSSNIVNCANAACHVHVPICVACLHEYEGACSLACQAHPQKRPYNIEGYYVRDRVGYQPWRASKIHKGKKAACYPLQK